MTPEQELIFLKAVEPARIARHLGTRARQARRVAKESQAVFAARAGIALRTYKRFEAEGHASLETFLRVLKALERAHYLQMLFPVPVPPKQPSLVEKVERIAARMRLRPSKPEP